MLKNDILQRIRNENCFFSLEFSPPFQPCQMDNFIKTINYLKESQPLFVSVTWHIGKNPENLNMLNSSLSVSKLVKNLGVNTMLNMACGNQSLNQLSNNLKKAWESGINNIFAIRGDLSKLKLVDKRSDLYSNDFIRLIRIEYGSKICIAVAGYPEGHPKSKSLKDDLIFLKSKVDLGADFILTQFFFNAEYFIKFVCEAKKVGIKIPIIPGILLVSNYNILIRICTTSRIHIPKKIHEILYKYRYNIKLIKNYGLNLAVNLCRTILKEKIAYGFHIFTMNQRSLCGVLLKILGFWPPTINCHEFRLLLTHNEYFEK